MKTIIFYSNKRELMKWKTFTIALIGWLAFVWVPNESMIKAQKPEDSGRLKEFTVRQGDLLASLQALSSQFDLPIALEKVDSLPNPDQTSQTFKDISLNDAYELLIAANPQYRWRMNDGVLEFVPIVSVKEYRFLDVQVEDFSVDELTVDEIKSQLLRERSVRAVLKADGLKITDISFASQGRSTLPRHSLHHQKATVREILNSLLKDTERNFWAVSRWGDKNQYLRIVIN